MGCGNGPAKTNLQSPESTITREAVDASSRMPVKTPAAIDYQAKMHSCIVRVNTLAELLNASAESKKIDLEVEAIRRQLKEFPRVPPQEIEANDGITLKSRISHQLGELAGLITAASIESHRRKVGTFDFNNQLKSREVMRDAAASILKVIAQLEREVGLLRSDELEPSDDEKLSVLTWGESSGKLLRYILRVDELHRSASAKFSGDRSVWLTLDLQIVAAEDQTMPILLRVARYQSKQKDADGFTLNLDSQVGVAENTDQQSFVDSLRILCQRDYPAALTLDSSIKRYSGWSTENTDCYAMAEQFEADLNRVLEQLLVPVDRGALAPHSWRLLSEWDELRDTVALDIKHDLVKVIPSGSLEMAPVIFKGSGRQIQGGEAPYACRVDLEGTFMFDVTNHRLESLKCTEKITTDNVLKTAVTRSYQMQLVLADQITESGEIEYFSGEEATLSPRRNRSIVWE